MDRHDTSGFVSGGCKETKGVRCQGFNGPKGPLGLGLGIRSSPCLGVK
jgi:hypothetical protein